MSTNETMSIHRKGYWPELWIELYRYSMVWRMMDERAAWDKGFPADSEEMREMIRMMKADARAENRTAAIGATEMCVRLMSKNLCVCGKHTARGVVVPRAKTKLEELRGAYPVCNRCVPDADLSHSFEVRDEGAGEAPDDDGANVESGGHAADQRSDRPRRDRDNRNAVGNANTSKPVAAKAVKRKPVPATIHPNRSADLAARLKAERARLADIEGRQHYAMLVSACMTVGTSIGHIRDKSEGGSHLRSGDRSEKRRAVYRILHDSGMSYAEIGRLFDTSHTSVRSALVDYSVGTFDSTEEAA